MICKACRNKKYTNGYTQLEASGGGFSEPVGIPRLEPDFGIITHSAGGRFVLLLMTENEKKREKVLVEV